MSDSSPHGATTSGQGTPVAVDVSADPHTRSTIALFLAGPVIWSVHFMVVYLAVEAGCVTEGSGTRLFGAEAATLVTLVGTVVAVLACLLTAGWAYRRWRAGQHQGAGPPGLEPTDRGGALAFTGFLLSLLGVVEVLFVGLPALVLPAC